MSAEDQPYQVMPPLSADEYAALRDDIAARGVLVPVEYDETGEILDGHHRVQICGELGISQWPRLIRHGLTETEKRQHARRLNLDRRHLDREQRRQLIAEDLRERPEASDRAIAASLGVDHKTVGSVRDGLEAAGEIPQLAEREGRDRRTRRLVQFVPATDGEKRGLLVSAKALRVEAEPDRRRIVLNPSVRRKRNLSIEAARTSFDTILLDGSILRDVTFAELARMVSDRAAEIRLLTRISNHVSSPVPSLTVEDALSEGALATMLAEEMGR